MPTRREIRIFDRLSGLHEAAAEKFIALANKDIAGTGRFTVALSGGSTPRGFFSLLAGEKQQLVPWQKIHFFWGDERHVPPDHPDSNYRMAKECMLSRVPVPPENIHRVRAEEDAEKAAADYEKELAGFFQLRSGQVPQFDLILLGMGPDGHTASLFPGTSGLNETRRLVIANWAPKLNADRITFTYPVLDAAACVMFMIAGADKAAALHDVLELGKDLPAGRVQPSGEFIWLIEGSAAARLSPEAVAGSIER